MRYAIRINRSTGFDGHPRPARGHRLCGCRVVESAFLPRVEGFEPPNGGTKTRCLTTWRHPIKLFCHWLVCNSVIAIALLIPRQLNISYLRKCCQQLRGGGFAAEASKKVDILRSRNDCSSRYEFEVTVAPDTPSLAGGGHRTPSQFIKVVIELSPSKQTFLQSLLM